MDVASPDRTVRNYNFVEDNLRSLLDNITTSKFLLSKSHGEILRQFYSENDYQLYWVTESGLTRRANVVINELQRADNYGLDVSDFKIPDVKIKKTDLAKTELIVSSNILQYVDYALGGRLDPRKLSKHIDYGPHVTDFQNVLKVVVQKSDPDRYIRSFHPKHPQFEALRKKYLALRNSGSRQSDVQKILVNMERWRWMPRNLGQLYVWASIPEFRVRVVNGGRVIHEANIVVGKISNQTPVFSDKMEYLEFHPYWNVPNSIKAAEIMPRLRHSTNVLRRENLRVRYRGRDINPYSINWRSVDARAFDFYQPPGRHNVLGYVKFMFPNKHSVYMHDTPSRHLLNRDVRLYSHGCMRVQNPEKLAYILLNRDKGWRISQINYLIRNGENRRVDLSRSIPVHITYFTAWVDANNGLRFFEDYYGHDRLIANYLIGKSNLIPTAHYAMASSNAVGYENISRPRNSGSRSGRQTRREELERWRRSFLEAD